MLILFIENSRDTFSLYTLIRAGSEIPTTCWNWYFFRQPANAHFTQKELFLFICTYYIIELG